MSKLSTEERNNLPDSEFAYIDKEGERHLPVHDEEHARNAVSRYPQTHFESKAAKERARKRILEAAKKHGIDVADDDVISKRVE